VAVIHRRGKKVTRIIVTFSGGLDAASALDLGHYGLARGVVKRRRLVYKKVVRLSSASYDPNARAVTLTLARPIKAKLQLTIWPGILAGNGTTTTASDTQRFS
jgi:hypothetical protein